MKARRHIPTPWMTTSEAVDYANARGFATVTERVIRRHAAWGLLKAYTAGKHRIRVRRDDVDEWLDTRPWNEYRDTECDDPPSYGVWL